MLPAKGPWPHPYYDIPDAFVDVSFVDEEGTTRHIGVRHKTLGDGPPMVLVHGLMNSSYSWRYVLDRLAKKYRVLAPDLVGSGSTDKPSDLVYSVANVARFIRAYVRTVSKAPVYLIGNSLGGLYCVRALLDEEDAGDRIARRFVLGHAPGYPMARARLMNALQSSPLFGSGLMSAVAGISHRWPRVFVAKNVHYHRKDMLCEEETVEHGRLFETIEGARVFMRIMRESVNAREHASVIAELRRRKAAGIPFPCPTRILYARKDVMVPPEFGPMFHADIPGSELVWMDDTSHFLHVDAPERTVEQIFSFDDLAGIRAA